MKRITAATHNNSQLALCSLLSLHLFFALGVFILIYVEASSLHAPYTPGTELHQDVIGIDYVNEFAMEQWVADAKQSRVCYR